MKTLFSNEKHLAALFLRVGFGFFIVIGHGFVKLQWLIDGNIQFPGMLGLSPTISLGLTTFVEFVAGIAVLIGFKTRLASIPLIITMLVAILIAHAGDPLFLTNGPAKEPAFMYLIGFVGTFLLGSGKYSVDSLLI
jgi:putative oxidoreductase